MSFNHRAAHENQENKRHIEFHKNGSVSIDTQKATYQGVPVKDLNREGRRKFENLVLLTNLDKAKSSLPKINYR